MHVFTAWRAAYSTIICLSLQNPNDWTILASWRKVACVDEFFDIIKEIHCKERGHVGSKKTVEEVFSYLFWYCCMYYSRYCLSNVGIEGVRVCVPGSNWSFHTALCSMSCPQASEYPSSTEANCSIWLHVQGTGMLIVIMFAGHSNKLCNCI